MNAQRGGFRHAFELGVGLILVALATRTWVVQGLIVPVTASSGSMATRILGPHATVTCRRCGYRYAVDTEQTVGPAPVTCPLCGLSDIDPPATPAVAGDPLLIDRTALTRGVCPSRWQVVVFRCPDRANQLAAKRIVGLPGETVAIRAGDVYINGRIARKGLPAQQAMAQLVHRAAWDREHKRQPRWHAEREQTGWQLCPDGFRYRPADPVVGQAAAIDWLGYHHSGDRPVRDTLAYNAGLRRQLHPVADLMLTGLVQLTGAGQLHLQADDGQHRFEVSIASPSGGLSLVRDGRQVARAHLPASSFKRPRRLVLSLFDAQLFLAIDDSVALRYAWRPADDRAAPPPPRPLAIGARRLDVVIRQLAVWRDVYYTRPRWAQWAVRGACRLGRDELFLLGDNSPISDDSRSWRNGPGLPERLLVGTIAGDR